MVFRITVRYRLVFLIWRVSTTELNNRNRTDPAEKTLSGDIIQRVDDSRHKSVPRFPPFVSTGVRKSRQEVGGIQDGRENTAAIRRQQSLF